MIKRADLVDISDKNYSTRKDEFIRCRKCKTNHGIGTRGDYFLKPMGYVFKCPACGSKDLALAIIKREIQEVKS